MNAKLFVVAMARAFVCIAAKPFFDDEEVSFHFKTGRGGNVRGVRSND